MITSWTILTVSVGPIARVDYMQLIFTETRPSAVIPDQTVANTIAQTSTNSALRQQMVLWRPHRDRVRMRWPFPMISGGNGHRGVKNGDGRGFLTIFSVVHGNCHFNAKTRFRSLIFKKYVITCRKKCSGITAYFFGEAEPSSSQIQESEVF